MDGVENKNDCHVHKRVHNSTTLLLLGFWTTMTDHCTGSYTYMYILRVTFAAAKVRSVPVCLLARTNRAIATCASASTLDHLAANVGSHWQVLPHREPGLCHFAQCLTPSNRCISSTRSQPAGQHALCAEAGHLASGECSACSSNRTTPSVFH